MSIMYVIRLIVRCDAVKYGLIIIIIVNDTDTMWIGIGEILNNGNQAHIQTLRMFSSALDNKK